jgi:hypothetical protein
MENQIVHRWYARPVLFVADLNRALRFYIDMLGFEKRWLTPVSISRGSSHTRQPSEPLVRVLWCFSSTSAPSLS